MKNCLALLLVLGTMSAFASSKEKVEIFIKADTKELCKFTSDAVFKGDVEGDLRDAGAYLKELSVCNKGLDGKYRRSVKFVRPTQNN